MMPDGSLCDLLASHYEPDVPVGTEGSVVTIVLDANLQRDYVIADRVRNPQVGRVYLQYLVDLVRIGLSQRVREVDHIARSQGGQVEEDMVAGGPRVADAVARDVGVGTGYPGEARAGQVARTSHEAPLLRDIIQHRHVRQAQLRYAQVH